MNLDKVESLHALIADIHRVRTRLYNLESDGIRTSMSMKLKLRDIYDECHEILIRQLYDKKRRK